jgi:cell wall-active antibiotic response 4TMS protein YvqF
VAEIGTSRAGLVAGVFFIVAGVAFLLERLDMWELEIRTLAPALLIALGFIVLLGARSGEDRS